MATAAGFLCFLPTDYKGISELGKIAGAGMLVAFLTSITTLPALLDLLNPPGENEPVGYAFLAPVDEFLEKHRVIIIVGTLLVALAGLPLLYFMKFDFNPMNLRNPKAESIATFLDLRKDPNTGANAINVMTTSAEQAKQVEARLEKVPEVLRVMSLDSFVPEDQQPKLKLIAQGAKVLNPALNPDQVDAAPSDQENVESLKSSVENLRRTAGDAKGPGAVASRRLADALEKLANSDQAARDRAQDVFITPMKIVFDQLRNALQAEPVTLKSLPPELVNAWKSKDGIIRVEAQPKGDPNDNDTLRKFAAAVLDAEPTAIGGPVSILKSGDTVVNAFIHAGIYALLVIGLLLWVTLRRITDVLMTLVPLLVAGAVTLEICVLIGLPLNFANIVAFPLLLGVGVAFKIYYVVAWRSGRTNLLQTSLTRAIFFSASGHVQHGQAARTLAGDDACRRAAIPARPNGQTPKYQGVGRCRRRGRWRLSDRAWPQRCSSELPSPALVLRHPAQPWAPRRWFLAHPWPWRWRCSRGSADRRGSRSLRRTGSPARSP
jgi:hopanoid biosynthesis associated RND transporter like protein HpnN